MKNGRKVTTILDSSHHSMRLISVCRGESSADEGYKKWKYMYLNGIFRYIDQFKSDEFIIAVDSRKNWRKEVYPYYKAHRKIVRDQDDANGETKDHWFNFDEYFNRYNDLLEEVEKHLPFKVILVDRAEADDVAAVLTNNVLLDNQVVLVTTDGDYVQLLDTPNVSIFNPIKKQFVSCDNPKSELLMKIFTGDKGDFVPSIADRHTFKPEFLEYCVKKLSVATSESNVKILLENDEKLLMDSSIEYQKTYGLKPSRVMGFSNKEAQGLINTDTVQQFLDDPKHKELKTKFIRNNKLVNLKMQPSIIKENIIKEYNNYHDLPSKKGLFTYFVKNKYNGFIDNIDSITSTLDPLYNK